MTQTSQQFTGSQPAPKQFNFTAPTGGGNWPKKEDMRRSLLMLTPVSIEPQLKYQGDPQKPGDWTERLVADTVVLDGPEQGLFVAMWWTPSGIVEMGRRKLASQTDSGPILGRLRQFPQKVVRNKYPDADSMEEAADRGETKFAWGLEMFTAADAEMATRYLTTGKFDAVGVSGTPLVDDGDTDPFA